MNYCWLDSGFSQVSERQWQIQSISVWTTSQIFFLNNYPSNFSESVWFALYTKHQHLSNPMEEKIGPLFEHYIFIDSVIKAPLSSKNNSSLSVYFKQSTFRHWGEIGMGISLWLKSTNNLKFHSNKKCLPSVPGIKRDRFELPHGLLQPLHDPCCYGSH